MNTYRCWGAALAVALCVGLAPGASAGSWVRCHRCRRVVVRRVCVHRRRWLPVRTVYRRPVRRVVVVRRWPRTYAWAPAYHPVRRTCVVRYYPRPTRYVYAPACHPVRRVYVVRSCPRPVYVARTCPRTVVYREHAAPVYVAHSGASAWRDNDDRGGHVPPGWSHGRKTGWGGAGMPPGLAKKMR